MRTKRNFLLTILFVITAVSQVYADGVFVWREGADLKEPTQRAVIYYKDGSEVLLLQVKYEGEAKDFGWIVPLPARPKVTAIEPNVNPFAELSLYTQRRVRWGSRSEVEPELESAVALLERKTAGVYDIAVISASDAGALTKWLNANGFSFPDNRKDVLEYYTAKKWVYAAMRIDPNALQSDEVKKLKTGELQPIRFEFKTKEAVYPLKISSINSGVTEVLLYILSDAPMVAKNPDNKAGLSIDENLYLGSTFQDPEFGTYRKVLAQELPLTWDALDLPKVKELSLCKYRVYYKTADMKEDLVFEKFDPMVYWKKQAEKTGGDINEITPPSILVCYNPELLSKYAEDRDDSHRAIAAANPTTPRQIFLKLAQDKSPWVKDALSANPKIPLDIMMILAEDSSVNTRIRLAFNPSIDLKIQQKLAKDKDSYVRIVLAKQFNLHPSLFKQLAEDPDAQVRAEIAANINVPETLLRKLAKDPNVNVRYSVARQARTPQDILSQFARDKDEYIRINAASNPSLPLELLSKLAEDPNFRVRRTVTYNSRTEVKILATLATDFEVEVRRGVAANYKTTSDILNMMASDKDRDVIVYVTRNPNTPSEVLGRLAGSRNLQVKMNVARHPRTPVEALKKLAADSEQTVRATVAINVNTPQELLITLSQDKEVYVRRSVIANPNCTEELLKKLALEKDPSISGSAKKALERYGY